MTRIWVVYERPSDFPGAAFVLRVHTHAGRGWKAGKAWAGQNLERLREHIPPGAMRQDRHPDCQPHIVEWWAMPSDGARKPEELPRGARA